MRISHCVAGIFSLGLMILGTSVVSGQSYPNKPIRIVTGPVGGGNDFVARLLSQGIPGGVGQPIIVDNRHPIIATETASKAMPDGYTLLVQGAAVWILPLLQKVNYDVEKDFSPVSLISRDVFVVVVHPSVPAKSIGELIALAKAKPGELNYAAAAPGGSVALSGALLKSMAGIDIVAVSYAGNGPVVTAVLSGEVQLTIVGPGLVAPHVKSGKLRALAVTSAQPSLLAPGLPTVAASGLPGFESTGMTGIYAPAKTPAAIIARLNQEIVRFLNRGEVKERFLSDGSEVVASSPEQFATAIRADIARWDKVIKDAGLKTN